MCICEKGPHGPPRVKYSIILAKNERISVIYTGFCVWSYAFSLLRCLNFFPQKCSCLDWVSRHHSMGFYVLWSVSATFMWWFHSFYFGKSHVFVYNYFLYHFKSSCKCFEWFMCTKCAGVPVTVSLHMSKCAKGPRGPPLFKHSYFPSKNIFWNTCCMY